MYPGICIGSLSYTLILYFGKLMQNESLMKTNFYVSYLAMSDNDNLEAVQDLLVIFPEMSGDVFGRLHPLSILLHV